MNRIMKPLLSDEARTRIGKKGDSTMMNHKSKGQILMKIGIGCFLAAGLVLLGICIFSDHEGKALLPAALGCIVIGNVLNFIRKRLFSK